LVQFWAQNDGGYLVAKAAKYKKFMAWRIPKESHTTRIKL